MPALTLVAAALYYALGVLWLRGRRGQGMPSFDLYTQFYPYIVHALHSLRDGGGLLWTPYQNCGQPFFADSLTGLLYPTNVFFALLDREAAVLAAVIVNLLIGGAGTYLLCRAMRLGVTAALSGALVFQLGGTSALMAAWAPSFLSVYVWIPVALWRLERLLAGPTLAAGVWLGVVLTLQSLPGYPQPMFFTYQLIGLRTVWALLGREVRQPLAVFGTVALGCALPFALAAVQWLPSLELMRDSVRGAPLAIDDTGFSYTWESLRTALGRRYVQPYPGNAVTVAAAVLCLFAVWRRRPRGLAVFYLVVAVLYGILSFGPNGLLYSWYARLPLGALFRMPIRFLWVACVAVAVLSAFGADALVRRDSAPSRGRPALVLALLAAGAALFFLVAGRPPTTPEWLALGGLACAGAWLAWRGRASAAAVLLVLAVFLNLASVSRWVVIGLRSGDVYGGNADAFTALHVLMTAQDRVALVGAHADLALMPKSASLFQVASIYDYAPQVSRAYGEFYTWLRLDQPLRSLRDWYYPIAGVLPRQFNERLFDLTGARYVLVGRAAADQSGRGRDWREVRRTERWRLYENPHALARARFVPRVAVASAERILPMLATGEVDPAQVALVSRPPTGGARNGSPQASGQATIAVNDAERVVLQVVASEPGYLYLADQYAPGWQATVNGAEAEILRANHAFRAVSVPAGASEVVFRYRPRSVYLGAALSGVTAALLLGGAVWRWRRGRKDSKDNGDSGDNS